MNSDGEKTSATSGLTLKLNNSPQYLESSRTLKLSDTKKYQRFLSFPLVLKLGAACSSNFQKMRKWTLIPRLNHLQNFVYEQFQPE